ncbi:DNA repair ATPase [Saccharophagus degradans]|uniref:DNA repair ATPase n=1 Tax=Saccharophagus degradans TaxID=86304 RepID=UPI001C09310E|nr:DNA repair ATPase [Saccharophagus degradans]MBU2986235.1 DNA repair ATPase [Saccharophagus degradans]
MSAEINEQEQLVDNAVAEGGAYEVIRKRLLEQGNKLEEAARQINQARLDEFGSSEMTVAARVRVRTENNCIARDIVQVGKYLLFGYNVFIGLKKETLVEDVFALFSLTGEGDALELHEQSKEGTFLADTRFKQDFAELYRYYKATKLVELTVKDGKLLMGFQIGERLEDIRVFRWAVSAAGDTVEYIDNRGERDIQLPPAYDFEWTQCTREDTVHGRHPHVNILDKVFVETVGGDLTIKIENNTEDGKGIYSESVEDKTQSIDDAEFHYAKLGDLILIKVLPYKETVWRYFVFNTLIRSVKRIDAVGASCVQLPEDHGIVFPGGYYLQNGEYKTFEEQTEGLRFKRVIRSPNGEDVLYVFYEPGEGVVALLAYNMIDKKLLNPIFGHGYALADDGRLVIFSAEGEPTRVHPMQIWQTPYVSDEFASNAPASQTFFGRIGNAALVRGISDLFSICRTVNNQSVSVRVYEELARSALKVFDDHYWVLDKTQQGLTNIQTELREIAATAELAVDEFAKVESIRKQSDEALATATSKHKKLIEAIRSSSWETAEEYVDALDQLRQHAGHLATIKSYRYINVAAIEKMGQELEQAQASLSERTVVFLSSDNALLPYYDKIESLNAEAEEAQTIAELKPVLETIEKTASGLDLLSELLSTLKVDDATLRTRIIDAISEVYSKLNQSKADARHKQKGLGSAEAVAEFSAQFKLFTQSITNALGLATTPESCEEQMSRLLVQLEELESQFSHLDQFLADIMAKREEIYETFESHKQRLLDERERRAHSLADAAERVLKSIEKRANKFTEPDKMNAYFAADTMVHKVREFVEQLRELNAAVKADDIEAKFKAIKEQSQRVLRDKSDIYEGGGSVIKLGPRHKFSVNTQELDLTIIPRGEGLSCHLTGTDYFESIEDEALLALKPYWQVSLESESDTVYRAEFLAANIIRAAELQEAGLSLEKLNLTLQDEKAALSLVREFATPRYKEGYEKGIHDHDAVKILQAIVPAMESADLLVFDPKSRGLAQVFWANIQRISDQLQNKRLTYETWGERAQSAARMREYFASNEAHQILVDEVYAAMREFLTYHPIAAEDIELRRAADYLVCELGRERTEFIGSKYASLLTEELKRALDDDSWRRFQIALEKMMGWPAERWNLSCAWLAAMVKERKLTELERYIPEAAAMINADERIDRRPTEADLQLRIDGLMGDHKRIVDRRLSLAVDEFFLRLDYHRTVFVKGYREYLAVRQTIAERERNALRLQEFKPRPLSSFVRNRLINEAYLPIIGDNLAKQMGTVGENKRTDLMGLLMMISPPGYGKTTLMEYVASRLGLIFMKINCPSLGHDVLSLDPEQAPNATARQELNKLNLALEMGNNVMLYLDDIQHTHPEFLQKFISLCDGTRRIEGIWKGRSKTYDMRGKKFCVVMAGNPYTESGEVFKIPDMLANRADIYNLGDVLGGMDEQFAMSYIENSLTSNPVLAPLAARDIADVYLLIKLAEGKDVATTDLKHQYSGAEINEIVDVLRKMFAIRDVILKINQQYIISAAQADKYRTEPPFKLQGSYRNMNKMGEKVSAVMNNQELMQLIQDHYLGEAQLLTGGAEENLLKLAELRGNMTDEQTKRWQEIKADFLRNKAMGGDDADTGQKVVAQLVDLVQGVNHIATTAESRAQEMLAAANDDAAAKKAQRDSKLLRLALGKFGDGLNALASGLNKPAEAPKVEVVNQPVPGLDKILSVLAETIEHSIFPLVRSMDKKLDIDLRTHEKMSEVSSRLRELEAQVKNNRLDKPAT